MEALKLYLDDMVSLHMTLIDHATCSINKCSKGGMTFLNNLAKSIQIKFINNMNSFTKNSQCLFQNCNFLNRIYARQPG